MAGVIGIIYGFHNNADKARLWQELLDMKLELEYPLLLMGDFNEVRKPDERKGCISFNNSMIEFDSWINEMGLVEVPLIGRKFTWRRGASSSRIDRVLAEPQWLQNIPTLRLSAIRCSLSDHIPLLVKSEEVNWGAKPFRSIDAWFSHPGFLKFVEEEWKGYGEMNVLEKFRNLKVALKKWNKEIFGSIDHNIQRFEDEIAIVNGKLDDGVAGEMDNARLNALKSQLDKWYSRRCCYWKQISREKIIKEGDRNFKYFHAMAAVRARRKQMLEIRCGRRVFRSPRSIKHVVRNFYKNLYKQKDAPLIFFQDGLVNKITQEESILLEAFPSDEEIKNAVWDCESSKAPGPDGYNFNFIKKCWNMIDADFLQCIGEFFRSGNFPKNANMTWVTLIPKIDEAKEIKDFRPISMIGCIYKVVAKVLANRLRSMMPGLIGETQSAYVQAVRS